MANKLKKKKQKPNTPFLAGIGCVVLIGIMGLVGRGYLYKAVPQLHWLLRGSPTQHTDKGKALFDEGKFAEAAEEYKLAAALKGTPDVAVLTAAGECYSHLILTDTENARRAVTLWENALTVDPNYLPALQKLLELYEDNAEMLRGADASRAWEAVHDKAKRLVAIDPKNLRAQISLQRSVIMRSFAGIETSPTDLDTALKALVEISQQKPFYADSILYAAQARMNQAAALIKMNNRQDASTVLDDTLKMVEDALEAHPDDAALHYRAGFISLHWAHSTAARTGSQNIAIGSAAELDKAVALIKPDQDDYVEIKLSVAKIIDSLGEHDTAQKMYRALLAERPQELQVRIALAETLDHSDVTREAIDLLEKARRRSSSRKKSGIKALNMQSYDRTRLFDLITAKLDQIALMRDQTSPEYQAVLAQIDDHYAKFTSTPGVADSPLGLQRAGRIEMSKLPVHRRGADAGAGAEPDAQAAGLELRRDGTAPPGHADSGAGLHVHRADRPGAQCARRRADRFSRAGAARESCSRSF